MTKVSDLVPVSDSARWQHILDQCGKYDTYHLPEYHQLYQDMGYGDAFLFVFNGRNHIAAFPFLLNCLDKLGGREYCPYTDVSSVYGYPGAITTISRGDPGSGAFRREFQVELLACLKDLGVVTLFSRLNPLIGTSWLFQGMCTVCPMSDTVSIDLAKPEERILGDMRENHRYRIKRALRRGVTVVDDSEFSRLSEFIVMYRKTMDRHNADESYYFPADYFSQIRDTMKSSLKLFHAYSSNTIVSSFLFFVNGDIVQYHLSGTPEEFLQFDGPRLIIYQAALWARRIGYRWLHLGGGVGANEDSLFYFKTGFSPIRHRFELIRMIVNEQVYHDLVNKRTVHMYHESVETQTFFPSYRHTVL